MIDWVTDGDGLHRLRRDGAELTFDAFLRGLATEPLVRAALTDRLRAVPHRGFWTRVAAEAAQVRRSGPRWLSTAGLGVSWLHVRLDTRPKYYRTERLRRLP